MDREAVFYWREECLRSPFGKCTDVCSDWRELRGGLCLLTDTQPLLESQVPGPGGERPNRT